MSVLDLTNNIMDAKTGLETYTGGSFKVLIAKVKEQLDITDFTDEDNKQGKYLIYPTNQGISPTVNQITADYVGSPTTDIYPGSTTYAGDLGVGGFPNSNAFYSSLIWKNKLTKQVEAPILVITAENSFGLYFTLQAQKVVRLEILTEKAEGDGYDSRFIEITEEMKISDLIKKIESYDGFSARLLIGDVNAKADLYSFVNSEKLNSDLVFGYNRIAMLECGILSDEEKKKYPNYINILKPEEGEPQYFNLLVYQVKNKLSASQYYGCQFKSLNFTFANNALTTINGSVWVVGEKNIKDGTFYNEREEKRDAIMAQTTNYPTKVFVNGLEAKAISDINVAFEWTKDDIYNVSMERYNVPNSKYTFTIGGNAMFNKQSEELFYNKLMAGQRLSIVIETNMRWRNKNYPFIFVCCDVNGQPSKPAISATGNLQVALNGFQALEGTTQMNSNYLITFTDREDLF